LRELRAGRMLPQPGAGALLVRQPDHQGLVTGQARSSLAPAISGSCMKCRPPRWRRTVWLQVPERRDASPAALDRSLRVRARVRGPGLPSQAQQRCL